ncbi:MAG: alpha/beta hydrolase fold domain-containing protein [Planctomycetota bacterium]
MSRQVLCLFTAFSWLILSQPVDAQTSETNARLKQGLKRYPEADTDQDGILTMDEAQAYLKQKRGTDATRGDDQPKVAAPEGGERYIYKQVGGAELPLYVFGRSAGAAKPAVVFFFGGGWRSGSPNQFEPQCKHLAQRGMVGITVEYRVSSRYPVKVEDCVEDAKSAMRWVRANAADLGIDPDRIASGGGSAGGHLAACTSVVDGVNADSDDLAVSAKPNAMVLFNPALAIASDPRMTKEELRRIAVAESRARTSMDSVSPLKFASTKQPPMIMFFGTEDGLLRGAEFYMQDSKEAGNTCTLITYEGQGHGFFNRNEYRAKTIMEMDQFLVGLGWLTAMER